MESDDTIVEKIMVLNYEMYKSSENDMKKVQNKDYPKISVCFVHLLV